MLLQPPPLLLCPAALSQVVPGLLSLFMVPEKFTEGTVASETKTDFASLTEHF